MNDELKIKIGKKIREARKKESTVLLMYGAHVIRRGCSLYMIELMRRGLVTHFATNGAGSIHDFELACLGGTSEYVPDAIEDGSFGMAQNLVINRVTLKNRVDNLTLLVLA